MRLAGPGRWAWRAARGQTGGGGGAGASWARRRGCRPAGGGALRREKGRQEEGASRGEVRRPGTPPLSPGVVRAGPAGICFLLPSLSRRIKRREGTPWGWHGVCGPGVIYSPRQPGAGCLAGPPLSGPPAVWGKAQKAGSAAARAVLLATRARQGACPEPSIGSWTLRKPRLPPKSHGARLSRQSLAFNARTHPFSGVYTGPGFPPPTWAQESQHMHQPSKEVLRQTGHGGESTRRP